MKIRVNKICLVTVIFFLIYSNSNAFVKLNRQINFADTITESTKVDFDGPYFFFNDNKVIGKWIKNNQLIEKEIKKDDAKLIDSLLGFNFDYNWFFGKSKNESCQFKNVSKIAALSDIHGQYDLFVKLLKNNKIVDDKLNWAFGDGHLVVIGDIFDRGDKHLEAFWLVYKLEKQAEKQGGKVHFLFGNHEIMVLNNDLRYLHPKYIATAQLMNSTYDKIFDNQSLLGSWLRKSPVIVTINDILFVHAGIYKKFVEKKLSIAEVNKAFQTKIIGNKKSEMKKDSVLKLLSGSDGPIWYRGYFEDEKLDEAQIDFILSSLKMKNIIVGHTSMPNITKLFGGKIFGIDSSIKTGETGEILIIEKGIFYKGTLNGEKVKL